MYEITNSVNGKTYVGKRKFDGDPSDDSYMGSSRALNGKNGNGAYAKYGRENFEKRVLVEGLTAEEAAAEELRLILEGKARGKCEYNIATTRFGGDVNGGRVKFSKDGRVVFALPDEASSYEEAGYVRGVPDELKRKISESLTGRKMPPGFGPGHSAKMKEWWANASPETRERVSKNVGDARRGTHPTDESRAKMSVSRRAYYEDHEQWNYGKTGVYTDEQREAMGAKNRGRKFSPERLLEHGSERRGVPLTEGHRAKLRGPRPGRAKPLRLGFRHAVRCVDTGEEFRSITDAVTRHPGCRHVGDVCRGLRSHTGGLKWEYVR